MSAAFTRLRPQDVRFPLDCAQYRRGTAGGLPKLHGMQRQIRNIPESNHPAPPSKWYPTRLMELPLLARMADVARVLVKCEGERPLGNFKSVGGIFAARRALSRAAAMSPALGSPLADGEHGLPRLICASDGNHGLAVAAAAQSSGSRASVYLPTHIHPLRVARIEAVGGNIVRIPGTYDDAVRAAAQAAARGEGLLIPDTSDDPDHPVVKDVMAGYGVIASELVEQLRRREARPSHAFVQAGVGGLAGAMAQGLREAFEASARLLVVEPESAACVARALRQGRPTPVPGDLRTAADMLSCGVASAGALRILQAFPAAPVLVPEPELEAAVIALTQAGGPLATPSGAAGVAGLLHVSSRARLRRRHRLRASSTVLLLATEGPILTGPALKPSRPSRGHVPPVPT